MIGSKPIICYLFFVLFIPTPHTSTVMYHSGLIWCILFYFVSFVELLAISLEKANVDLSPLNLENNLLVFFLHLQLTQLGLVSWEVML